MFGAGWRCQPPWPYDPPRLSRPVSEPSDIIQHLEVPARFERAITDLQSAALTNLAMEPYGTAPRFRSSSSWVKARCASITPVRYLVREVRFELTCPKAPGFESGTYTSSVTRAWCLPRESNPQSLRRPVLSRTCIPIPPGRHSGDPCGT